MATTIQRSALVLHSAERMYKLVNDVESYPEFMADCRGAEILEQGEGYMIARLDLYKKGLSYSFTTYNTLKPYGEIVLALHSGPFRSLSGVWQFKPLSDTACKVSLHLEFDAKSGLLNAAVHPLFASVASNLVAALTSRASTLYGTVA